MYNIISNCYDMSFLIGTDIGATTVYVIIILSSVRSSYKLDPNA